MQLQEFVSKFKYEINFIFDWIMKLKIKNFLVKGLKKSKEQGSKLT